ncbi:YgiQ family radical SAM protein [Proteiniphilum sp. X52]|uniref:YgiQ family radical SAM protein n=1 Tax=Proteiniphilum sp. X52 TaxID=2382159 RepID=UPI000F0A2EA7|nr:YgiQ family radical SAM protein [Proteiniphilum sp. X52]RNC64178.1 YgiQ family radical SAM protein [Proteiniphilum sp. X52]
MADPIDNRSYQLTDWLPTTKKELDLRGWDTVDVILFSGDAYIDHPSFGTAVIGRLLESQGLRVAIVPQPNWRDDLRDFKKLGAPRLFFAVTAGVMDSMINHYTANKRLRSEDAYTPDGRADMRPDRAVTVYCRILKELYPDVAVVIGGVEASLRRITHYDYWNDKLHKSILADTKADLLIYGMGELPLKQLICEIRDGKTVREINDIPQTAFICTEAPENPFNEEVTLFSHEECAKDKLKQAKNFRMVEEQSNRLSAARLLQKVDGKTLIVNPPYPPMKEEEIDASFDLPYTRLPHPKYKGKHIPAYEMIKFSVNLHRGCFGGCAFCTISAHQGKFIASRSRQSILDEVKKITQMPDFKGYISDLGGPSANMYRMQGKDLSVCEKCKKPSCIFPKICFNLNTDHSDLLDIYKAVDSLPGIKKSFIGSGIRYDMLLQDSHDAKINESHRMYLNELIRNHVSGRLKVAPEHTSETTLKIMRKPSFRYFDRFKQIFDELNKKHSLNQQLVPYFISSHPGCNEEDMAELAVITKKLHFKLEQVQDFTPSPMTLATEIYYTGYHPYTLQPVYTAKSREEKNNQRQFFFWYDPTQRLSIIKKLKRIGRADLVKKLYSGDFLSLPPDKSFK